MASGFWGRLCEQFPGWQIALPILLAGWIVFWVVAIAIGLARAFADVRIHKEMTKWAEEDDKARGILPIKTAKPSIAQLVFRDAKSVMRSLRRADYPEIFIALGGVVLGGAGVWAFLLLFSFAAKALAGVFG